MKNKYLNEVASRLRQEKRYSTAVLTEKDMQHLPEPVKRYIRYAGFVGKEKISNVFLKASGQIRSSEKSGWMQFTSEQYNFFENPFRAFYIRAVKMGVPAVGLHLYKNETATMVIKLLNLFTVVDAKGPEMNQAETVTVLNDMCFMAPGSLISKNITWETMNASQVKATFTNGQITVSAILTFDEEGKLMNFISFDRFETSDGKVADLITLSGVAANAEDLGTFTGVTIPDSSTNKAALQAMLKKTWLGEVRGMLLGK